MREILDDRRDVSALHHKYGERLHVGPPLRILLITPPFQYFPGSGKPMNYIRPPLGICYLSAYARKFANVTTRLIDSNAGGFTADDLKSQIIDWQPDLVGFSVTTPTVHVTCEIIRSVRPLLPQTVFIAGGPHATMTPEDLVEDTDAVVLGEGEETFLQLIAWKKGMETLEGIPGLMYSQDGEVKRTSGRQMTPDLDSLPIPDRDMLTLDSYQHILDYNPSSRFTTVFASRGCYYKCTFCANDKIWGATTRFRTIPNVMEEVRMLVRSGFGMIFFDDDNFMADTDFVRDLCNAFLSENLKFQWIIHARVLVYDDDLLALMSRAGCTEAQLGVESFNKDALVATKKKYHPSKIDDCIAAFRKHGINTWATMIIGLPHESRETVKASVRQIIRANPTYATFILLLPFPGSQIYEEYHAKGYIRSYNWSDYTWHGDPVFETDLLNRTDLKQLRRYAYRRFYLRPRKLMEFIMICLRHRMFGAMVRNIMRFAFFSLGRDEKIR